MKFRGILCPELQALSLPFAMLSGFLVNAQYCYPWAASVRWGMLLKNHNYRIKFGLNVRFFLFREVPPG